MTMWEAVAARGSEVHFAPGDVLVHHGETTRHCYAIRRGEVLVTASSSQGSTVVLARRGPDALIGELAALDGAPRSATVRAVTEVVADVLTAADLEALLREQPDLALVQLRRLSRQMRQLARAVSVIRITDTGGDVREARCSRDREES